MKWRDLEQKTRNLLVLEKEDLKNLEKSESTLDFNVKYWLKKDKLVKLKNGSYLIRDKWNKEDNKDEYLEYIANQLILPSYVSLEYVLAKFQILTDAQMIITSVTTKSGRRFANKIGVFGYYSISEKLFTGYETKKFKNAYINIASKEKALFDYLYFYFLQKEPNKKNIENLRINWENITKKELEKSRKFCKLTNNKNIKKVFEIIC
jgi:predicted transcriptional regulator of viral defense system